jgi:hypothetical protein
MLLLFLDCNFIWDLYIFQKKYDFQKTKYSLQPINKSVILTGKYPIKLPNNVENNHGGAYHKFEKANIGGIESGRSDH